MFAPIIISAIKIRRVQMAIRGIFSRRGPKPRDEEEMLEVNVMDTNEKSMGKLGIKIAKLEEFSDADRIIRHLREGSIIFLKIKGLKDKDMGELKRAVEKLKKAVVANNGDIAGVEQDWLVLTPEYATVHRQ